MNDYKYFENVASRMAVRSVKIKLLEAQINGDIVPDYILEMLDEEIKKYENI